jgi:hypothetical protein
MRRPLRSDEARGVANLAIDLGDPGRMARARRLHRANAVAEVEIEAGHACATVTQSDGDVFDVDIGVAGSPLPGAVPVANDLTPTCSCDDDGDACTHALAALLGIAEEIEANGRLLDVWVGSEGPAPSATYIAPSTSSADSFFLGVWAEQRERVDVSQQQSDEIPTLVVDSVDAGPVVIDAIRAIRAGLSRYRVRR